MSQTCCWGALIRHRVRKLYSAMIRLPVLSMPHDLIGSPHVALCSVRCGVSDPGIETASARRGGATRIEMSTARKRHGPERPAVAARSGPFRVPLLVQLSSNWAMRLTDSSASVSCRRPHYVLIYTYTAVAVDAGTPTGYAKGCGSRRSGAGRRTAQWKRNGFLARGAPASSPARKRL